jgi:hypothetical protein
MALTEAEVAILVDNQFAYDGNAGGAEHARHLPCDEGIYLEEPADIEKALDHLPDCPNPNGPAHTWRGNVPWAKGSEAQEEKKRSWLQKIHDHPDTTDADYSAAVTMLVDPLLPVDRESSARLATASFVIVRSDGTCVAVDAW